MEDWRFDQLATQWGRSLDRRRIGQLLALIGFGGFLRQSEPARAKKKKKKCKAGTIKCGKSCVDPRTNALNCGGCGTRCGNGRACVKGKCQTGCPQEQILCGALCVDPRNDDDHCGDCATACQGELTCSDGHCGCDSGARCGDECCGANETCQGSTCVPVGCGANQRSCGGGVCIPDDIEHCCNNADCGDPNAFNQITCDTSTHRCVCKIAGYGICQRFPNLAGACSPCCPGATVDPPCSGNAVCIGDSCACPPTAPNVCPGTGLCFSPAQPDDCCFNGDNGNWSPCAAGRRCCNGVCTGGCAPGVSGCFGAACPGNNCEPCPGNAQCCRTAGQNPTTYCSPTQVCPT